MSDSEEEKRDSISLFSVWKEVLYPQKYSFKWAYLRCRNHFHRFVKKLLNKFHFLSEYRCCTAQFQQNPAKQKVQEISKQASNYDEIKDTLIFVCNIPHLDDGYMILVAL